MTHPSDYDLVRYARLTPDGRAGVPELTAHLADCPHCADELAIIEEWLAPPVAASVPLPPLARLLLQTLRSVPRHVALAPLAIATTPATPMALAADGSPTAELGWKHRATLFSENPELVLRVMHDPQGNRDILHLSGADTAHARHVYIHLDNPDRDFLTDERGIAEVSGGLEGDPVGIHWQVRLPDATFTLSPLEWRNRSSDGRGQVLESPDGNRVEAILRDAGDGVTLQIRPLEIGGQTEFEHVRIVVSQMGGHWRVGESSSRHEPVSTQVVGDQPIEIRLFVI